MLYSQQVQNMNKMQTTKKTDRDRTKVKEF